MVNTAKTSLTKYRQGKHLKYFIYLPLVFSDDSMFPCKLEKAASVKVWVRIVDGRIMVEPKRVEKNE